MGSFERGDDDTDEGGNSMDDNDEVEVGSLPARRFGGIADLFVMGTGLVADIADAFNTAFVEARQVAAMHANWKQRQEFFHEQAAREIETLTSGDDNG